MVLRDKNGKRIGQVLPVGPRTPGGGTPTSVGVGAGGVWRDTEKQTSGRSGGRERRREPAGSLLWERSATGRQRAWNVYNVRGEAGATGNKADLRQLSSVTREGEQPGLHVPTVGPDTRTSGGAHCLSVSSAALSPSPEPSPAPARAKPGTNACRPSPAWRMMRKASAFLSYGNARMHMCSCIFRVHGGEITVGPSTEIVRHESEAEEAGMLSAQLASYRSVIEATK